MIKTEQPRPLASLATLAVVHLLLLSLQLRTPEGQVILRSWTLSVFIPVSMAVHLLAEQTETAVQKYLLLSGAQQENQLLRMENRQLKVRLVQLHAVEELVSRSADYQLLRRQYLFDTVVAGVVWKGSLGQAERILINAGMRHGVGKDAAVLAPEGIVGRVRTSSALGAEVELITSPGAAAGAVQRGSRLQGIIQGNGSALLEWNFIPNYERVPVGEIAFTSGTDQIYPKGLPIGRIVLSEKGPSVYRRILVKPFVDSGRLEEVIVALER